MGCATHAAAQTTLEQPGVTFEQHEVVIGFARRQTVVTGFLLGGAIAELAVVNIDENAGRRLRVYTFVDDRSGPGWIPLNIALRGGTDESRTTREDHLRAFNPTLLLGDVTGDGRTDLLMAWRKTTAGGPLL